MLSRSEAVRRGRKEVERLFPGWEAIPQLAVENMIRDWTNKDAARVDRFYSNPEEAIQDAVSGIVEEWYRLN